MKAKVFDYFNIVFWILPRSLCFLSGLPLNWFCLPMKQDIIKIAWPDWHHAAQAECVSVARVKKRRPWRVHEYCCCWLEVMHQTTECAPEHVHELLRLYSVIWTTILLKVFTWWYYFWLILDIFCPQIWIWIIWNISEPLLSTLPHLHFNTQYLDPLK